MEDTHKNKIVSNIWRWLSEEKDAIASIATLLQACAIVVGMVVVVNEFVVKDKNAELSRINRAFEIFRGGSGFDIEHNLGSYWMDFLGVMDQSEIKRIVLENADELDKGISRAILRYTEIQACLNTSNCDEKVIRHLFCVDAFFDSLVAYKIVIKPPGWIKPNYDARLDNLFDFSLYCLNHHGIFGENILWQQRRSPEWDPVLGDVFNTLDKRMEQELKKVEGAGGKDVLQTP